MEQQGQRDQVSGQGAGSYTPDIQPLSVELVSDNMDIKSTPRQHGQLLTDKPVACVRFSA